VLSFDVFDAKAAVVGYGNDSAVAEPLGVHNISVLEHALLLEFD
jgi:hypothetical protein